MKKIRYDADHHQNFETEWGLHRGNREWWYATGIMFDEDGHMYSWQYTLLHLSMGLVTPKVAMVALTDYENQRHYYLQTMPGKGTRVRISEKEASVTGVASAVKEPDGMHIQLFHKDFTLDLLCSYGKGPVWHCDDGKLQMGIPGEKATTLYYSWTNMPTEGTLIFHNNAAACGRGTSETAASGTVASGTVASGAVASGTAASGTVVSGTAATPQQNRLHGKTWFDKQGGPYNMANMKCHWEWFSLRFFDDEEAMLFTFPHNEDPEFDGTFIARDGSYHRLNDYKIESLAVTEFKGLKWSSGWRLHMNEKEQDYTIEPLQEGHMNFAYFEELCAIKNAAGEMVGYAFAELLPGVLNSEQLSSGNGGDISMKNLFARVEF